MKPCITLLFALILNIGYGQGTFKINSQRGPVKVILNVDTLVVDSNYIEISTNYPDWDTLQLRKNKILCNFHPDSVYSFVVACCDGTDIVYASKTIDSLSIWDYDKDFAKFQRQLMNAPRFIIQVENAAPDDEIYGMYVDHACFPSFKEVTSEPWGYGPAAKCYYWNNISHFMFFTSDEDFKADPEEEGVIKDIYPEESEGFKKLAGISVRLFDDQDYVLIYDAETQKIALQRR